MQNLLSQIRSRLNIYEDETDTVALLYSHSMIAGIIKVFFRTAAYSLFLTQFSISRLPFVYIAAAGTGLILSGAFALLQRFADTGKQIISIIVLMLIVNTGLSTAVSYSPNTLFIFLLPVWNELLINFIDIETGIVQSRYLTLRQGKRLFSFIQSGEFLAESLAGVLIAFIVRFAGSEALSTLSSLFLLALLFLYFFLRKKDRKKNNSASSEGSDYEENGRRRYIFLLALSYILLTIIFYLSDNSFYHEISSNMSSEEEIASFLGKFTAISSMAILILLTFISGKFIEKKGVLLSWMILPVLIIIPTALLVFDDNFNISSKNFFLIVIFVQFIKITLAYSFNKPSMSVLYQALNQKRRNNLHTLIYGIIDPVFLGISGGILLLLNTRFNTSSTTVFTALLPMLLLWILVKKLVCGDYRKILHSNINVRHLGKVRNTSQRPASKTEDSAREAGGNTEIYLITLIEEIKKNPTKRELHLAAVSADKGIIDLVRKNLISSPFHRNVEAGVTVLSLIDTNESAALLLPLIKTAPKEICTLALGSLTRFGSQSEKTEDISIAVVFELCELKNLINRCIEYFIKNNFSSLFIESLFEEKVRNRKLVFQLLYLIYRKELLLDLEYITSSGQRDKIDYALEYIDTTIRPDLKKIVLPFIEESFWGTAANDDDNNGEISNPVNTVLQTRLMSLSAKSLLIQNLSKREDTNKAELVSKLINAGALKNEYLYNMIPQLMYVKQERSLSSLALHGEHRFSYAQRLERLKSVSIFSYVQLDDLIKIAAISKYHKIPQNTVLYEPNKVCFQLSYILSGTVKATASHNVFIENQVLFELAVLHDDTPDENYISTSECELLVIKQSDLFDLMQGNIEIYQNIIKVLCNKNRNIIARRVREQ